MRPPYPTARDWAEGRSTADRPRLGMLEAVAFQGHPEVVALLGPDGAALARVLRGQRSLARRVGGTVLGVVAVVALASPVAGISGVAAYSYFLGGPDAALSIPFAYWCFWVTAMAVVVLGIMWITQRAPWSPGVMSFGAVSAVCAGFAAVAVPAVAVRDGVVVPEGYLLPMGISMVAGVVLAVGVALRRGTRRNSADDAGSSFPDSSRAAQTAVHALSAREQSDVLVDRNAALQILAERGHIDGAVRDRAVSSPLGTLHLLDARIRHD